MRKDGIVSRTGACGNGALSGFEEVGNDLAVIEIAAGNGQAHGIAALGGALRGADDVAAPPFSRAEALTEG